MTDISDISALISSLSNVERGSGLRQELDTRSMLSERRPDAPTTASIVVASSRKLTAGVARRDIHLLTDAVREAPTNPAYPSGADLLDSSKFEKGPDCNLWPAHIREYKEKLQSLEQSTVKLPVLHQMSPRSKRKLDLMPTANALDLSKASKYERIANAAEPAAAYRAVRPKKRTIISAPAQLKKLASKPMLSQTQSSDAVALRLVADVPMAVTSSYFSKYDEYRKKVAHKQEAFEAIEQAAAGPGPGHTEVHRSFHYPADSKLLGMLTKASDVTARAYAAIGHGDATDSTHSGDASDMPLLKEDYAPIVREAVRLGHTLTKRQAALDRELALLNRRIENAASGRFMDTWRGALYDDIGLDVDPEFNRRRLFGDAWKTLAYYVGLFRLRAGMQLLWLQTQRTTAGMQSNAGDFLSRIFWGHRARVRVWHLRENMRLQREAEILHEKVEDRYRRFNHLKIFRACFSYRVRVKAARLKMQHEMVTRMQCFWRSILATARVRRLRRYYKQRVQSSIRIQAQYRRHYAARHVIFLRKYALVQRWENFQEMKHHERLLRMRHTGAAYTIERFYRAYILQKRLQTLLYWHHFELCIQMQRMVRGFLARQKCRRQIIRFRRIIKLKIKRITILQSLWRGRVGRKKAQRARDKKMYAQAERRRRKEERLALAAKNSQWPMLPRKISRALHPFRYIYERKRAIEIQRVWRGHRGRRRRLIVAARARVIAYFQKLASRWQGAICIQRMFRGYVVRKKFIIRRKHRMAIKIQTQYRIRMARKRMKHRALYIATSTVLYNMVSRLYLCRRYRRLFMHNLRLRVPIRILQRSARRYIARKSRRAKKDSLRHLADKRSSEALATYRALGCAQLAILQESLLRPIGKKATGDTSSICGREAKCLGPVQALYTYSITPGKALFDNASLPNNRIDSSATLKLMQKLPDLYAGKGVQGKARKAIVVPTKSKKKKNKEHELHFSLMECFHRHIILLPKKIKKLYQNDVDVAFNKAKFGGGTVLNYEEFCNFLQVIAVGVSERCPIEGDEDEIETRENKSLFSNNQRHTYFFPYHDLLTKNKTFAVGMAATVLGSLFEAHCNKPKPAPNVAAANSSISKVAVEARESWIADVIQWLEDEARARVGIFVTRMQRMVRRHRSKHILQHAKSEIWRSTEKDRRLMAHKKCQALVRRFLARIKVVKVAQLLLVRYVPYSGPLYWHNPRTNVSQWTKPKILRSFDCVSIALPPPLLEYTIKCSNCTKLTAEVNCRNCGDSFCRNCFDSLHCKGKRQLHVYEKIPMCCRCHYQCATKNCATCTLRRPKKGTVEALVRDKRNFGNYCDTCFTHIHDAVNKGNATSVMNRTVASELEDGSIKDAYLVGQALHQRVITDHKFGDLVQPCEECQWRSAAWRCVDCDQVYCNKCLQGLHSFGPFSSHSAEKLPYYPPSLHSQTLKDSLALRVADKIDKIKRAFQRRVEHERLIYCIILQTWWRRVYYSRIGRAYMKEQRRLQRRAHRVRKYEDIHMRSTLDYKVRDVLGIAPTLKSDTKEERILKQFSVFRRQDIRRFIYPNRGDKYYVLKQLQKLKEQESVSASADNNGNLPEVNKFISIRMPTAYLSRPKSPESKKGKRR